MVSQPAPIARSVADLALALRVLAAPGQESTDPTVPPVVLRDPAEVKRLRIAFYTDNGILKPSPSIRRALIEAAAALAMNGAEVEEWRPPDLQEAWEIQLRLTCADGLAGYRRALRNSKGAKVRLAAMPALVRSTVSLLADLVGQRKLAASMRLKHRASIREYFQLLGRRRQYSAAFLQALNAGGFDAILCPPDALPALKHGSSYYISGCGISYAGLYTLLGMPAGVVAATRVKAGEESDRPQSRDLVERAARYVESGSAGLPIGVQVVARHWREDVVLAIMRALEAFFRRQPDFPACPGIATLR
jgi:fatty acid amide hydrolase